MHFKFSSIFLSFLSVIIVGFVHLVGFFETTNQGNLNHSIHIYRVGALGVVRDHWFFGEK